MEIKTGVFFGILYSILQILLGVFYKIIDYFQMWDGIFHKIVSFIGIFTPLLLLLFFISFLTDNNQKNIPLDEFKN